MFRTLTFRFLHSKQAIEVYFLSLFSLLVLISYMTTRSGARMAEGVDDHLKLV